MSPFVYPPHLTDEEKAERRRLAEQRERIELVKAILVIVGVTAAVIAVGCGLLYLAGGQIGACLLLAALFVGEATRGLRGAL